MNWLDIPAPAPGLLAALAIGLLVGLERGWNDRELPEGARVAGLRTFALTGLFGGVLATLLPQAGVWPLAGGLLGLALILANAYRAAAGASGDFSITTSVAMLLTCVLGAYAALGQIALALAAAVIATVLLAMKPTLHGWLRLIEYRELTAALQLLVLSVVILPALPDSGYGPFAALNPYRLWWAVILIAGLSLAGHLAMRITGSRRGIFLSGALGGLASSTAATLAMARFARTAPALTAVAGAGAIAASGIMFFRMALVISLLQPSLARSCGLVLVVTGAAFLGAAWRQWQQAGDSAAAGIDMESMKPFDLSTALGFGVFLAVIAVLVPAAKQWLGAGGVYVVAAISGVADVDAIVISLARLHGAGALTPAATVLGIAAAALSNTVMKASLAFSAGGRELGARVLRGYAIGLGGGLLALLAGLLFT